MCMCFFVVAKKRIQVVHILIGDILLNINHGHGDHAGGLELKVCC